MKRTISAGGVVLDPRGRILITNQRGNSWSLPKGHVDAGESLQQAARREIREETGVSRLVLICELGRYVRPRIGLRGGNDRTELKTLHFFLFRAREGETALRPQDPMNPEARWVTLAQALRLLTHARDRAFLASVGRRHLLHGGAAGLPRTRRAGMLPGRGRP